MADIKKDYDACMDRFLNAIRSDVVDVDFIHFLSLGILLNIDLSQNKELLATIDKFQISNGCVDLLLGRPLKEDLLQYPDIKRFRPWIAELYREGSDREAIISKQLSNWYRSHQSTYFYGYDKSEESLYFGYWALEIASFVKILQIPDDSFKDKKYYPYDLVHFGG